MDRLTITAIVCGIIDIPLFILIGKLMFGSWEDFWEAIKFWLTPDIWSAFSGEYWEDRWAEMKLGFFILLCGGCVVGEIVLINEWITPLY